MIRIKFDVVGNNGKVEVRFKNCPAVPSRGDFIQLGGQGFTVSSVWWNFDTDLPSVTVCGKLA